MRQENHTFFFYGTLMDRAILNRVTGVYFQPFNLRPGILKNFKRVTVKNCNYPAILESEGNEVEGIVVNGITADAVGRLDEFEDNNYERKNVTVALLNRSIVNATAYVAGSEMLLDDIAWDFDSWYRIHRSEFLKRFN